MAQDKRDWLADLLREACKQANACMRERPAQGRCAFVVGYLLSEARLTDLEAQKLMDSVA